MDRSPLESITPAKDGGSYVLWGWGGTVKSDTGTDSKTELRETFLSRWVAAHVGFPWCVDGRF